MIEAKAPSGGPAETAPNNALHSPVRIAAYHARIIIEGYESLSFYTYWICKNITLGEDGEIRFFHLVPNKRIDGVSEPEEKDYPPMEPGENMIDYITRIEQLPYMEWQMAMFEEFQSCNFRGRTLYTVDDAGKHHFISGDKLSIKPPEEDKPNVVDFKGGKK